MILRQITNDELLFLPYHTNYTRCGLSGTLNKKYFYKAIQDIVGIHPFLSARVTECNDKLYFEKKKQNIASIEFIDLTNNKKKYCKLIDELQNSICNVYEELAKFFIIVKEKANNTNFDFIALTSHLVTDGITVMELIYQILSRYNELLNGKAKKYVGKFHYPRSIYEAMSSHFSELTPLLPRDERVEQLLTENKLFTLTPKKYDYENLSDLKTKTLNFEIEHDDFYNLINACKKITLL